ncbi:cupredoxin domain-containing protein [Halobellus captivus]|uniref:cupredoxin domain-containing protein n=1 Tax=Halobellus captivus TaxID=2592614 RepID=UPI0011A6B116|nr:plastocyanin/azurin family copper-binding protein [Halobellus captivus]
MNRRSVLKTVGGASLLPTSGGVVSARGTNNTNTGASRERQRRRECPRPNCIHPVLGYTGLSADESVPAPIRPDHEVALVTRPPGEDDDRPIPEFFFEPTGLHVSAGDVVRFNLMTPDHTVTAYHPGLGRQRRVPEGVPPFSSPVLAGGAFWLYRFDTPGVYDLLCAPHEIFGMVGRVVVGNAESDFGDAGPQLRPPELTAALVFDDPALRPDNIVSETTVGWAELAPESKQLLIELTEGDSE